MTLLLDSATSHARFFAGHIEKPDGEQEPGAGPQQHARLPQLQPFKDLGAKLPTLSRAVPAMPAGGR
ncbi:hypothetical protein GGTG_08629 [Gaeumannomyces tritici R3-111a-1]|uniref:Uncharacterized protein n=1 Tax=Gaeumannomyces tritici (strain R3-111a-1) TaxID=644352 RepID=J3P543_GAET3|nr:hypothetical protein GGTG_08629 [Gaeumannomyces tritici R3-111a-1]EJT74791.1 hypothetical protein GGTG_08629 [Gaeumannomyces tritici R3-111a-1]